METVFSSSYSGAYTLSLLWIIHFFCLIMISSEVVQSCPTLCNLHGLEPARLLCPWDFPGKSAGAGCHFLLQEIFPTQRLNPDLPHCRQMLYHLSRQGSPDFQRISRGVLKYCSILNILVHVIHLRGERAESGDSGHQQAGQRKKQEEDRIWRAGSGWYQLCNLQRQLTSQTSAFSSLYSGT